MIWTEKYRPNTLSDVIGQDEVVAKLTSLMRNLSIEDIPHFLFVGKAGIGKTATAQAFAKDLKVEFIEFNASKDRDLEFIRTQISKLSELQSTTKRKVIFLDESDSITPLSQFALRRIMEENAKNTIFILACNRKRKILEEIVNRTIELDFNLISDEDLVKIGKKILASEGRTLKDDVLMQIAKLSKGSAREFINRLVLAAVGGYIPTSEFSFPKYIESVKAADFSNLYIPISIVRKISTEDYIDELVDYLTTLPYSKQVLQLILEVGHYSFINPNIDDYLLKKILTVTLWSMKELL